MEKKLENKVAFIIGGSTGIGNATATLFAAQGARVAIAGRTDATIKKAAAAINHEALGVVCDVTDLTAIKNAYEEVISRFGKIDVLVANAGIIPSLPLAEFTEELFDRICNTNFKGAFFSVQIALPYLNDGASIIMTSSSLNETGVPRFSAYSATKAAIRSLARSFSVELLQRNIRVNVLSPGMADTQAFAKNGLTQQEIVELKVQTAKTIPLQRLASVEELAEGYLFLASDASKYMVGSELVMDGGAKTF